MAIFRHPSKDVPIVYEVKTDSLASVEALTRYDKNSKEIIITLLESTYKNLERDDRRARFTLSHEIAHPVLHLSLLIQLSNIPHRQAALFRGELAQHPSYLDTEWQADAFAAAFLMPAQGLAILEKLGILSLRTIERRFKVSGSAAEIRLKIFNQRKDILLRA